MPPRVLGKRKPGQEQPVSDADISPSLVSHQSEYFIEALRICLLNERGFGFYNADDTAEESNIECTW
jgi:hypothetical protein